MASVGGQIDLFGKTTVLHKPKNHIIFGTIKNRLQKGWTSIMDEYTACEQAYENGYEAGKEAAEVLQKEIARLARESVKRDLALAKLEAETEAIIERLSREQKN